MTPRDAFTREVLAHPGRLAVVLRGCQGAGKTTLARELQAGWNPGHLLPATLCAADDYFADHETGLWRFDPEKLPAAHGECLRRWVEAMQGGLSAGTALAVVHNTGATVAEVAPYAALALAYGWSLRIVTLDLAWQVCAGRQVHGVPEGTVQRTARAVREETARFPPWWSHTTLRGDL